MAIHAAAHHDAQVVGITISRAQAELARKRVAEAGRRPTGSRSGCRTTASWPASSSTRSRRSACPSTSGKASSTEYFHDLRAALRAAGPAAEPRHLVGRWVEAGAHVVRRPLRVPRRRAGRRRRRRCWRWSAPGFEVRDVESLREHYARDAARTGSPTSRATGTRRSHSSASAGARIWRLYMAGSAVGVRRRRHRHPPGARRGAHRRRRRRHAGDASRLELNPTSV